MAILFPLENLFVFSPVLNLKSCGESIKSSHCLCVSSLACISLFKSCSSVGVLDSTEENISLLLLVNSLSKSTYCSTSLIHVTGKFVSYIEPFLFLNVSWDLCKTILGLSKNCLLTCSVLCGCRIVKSLRSLWGVYRVWGVKWLLLVRSISSTLRVRRSISNKSENRETWGFSYSSVSSSRKESSSSSSDLSENLTASLSVYSGRNASVVSLYEKDALVLLLL